MSCQGMSGGYHKRAYFTLKMGAYLSGSGIRFTHDFYEEVKTYSLENKLNELRGSENNVGTYLQMGIHQQGNYLIPFTLASGSGSHSMESIFPKMLGPEPLSNDIYAGQMAEISQENGRINYFGGLSDSDLRIIEGQISMNQLRANQQEVLRNSLEGVGSRPGLITLGYTQGRLEGGQILGPDQSPARTKAFGRGYKVSFGHGHLYDEYSYHASGSKKSPKRRILSTVREIALQGDSSKATSPWVCPESVRFMVFRPWDIRSPNNINSIPCAVDNNGIERPVDSATLEDPQRRAIYKVLRHADWAIDFDRVCVVPKQGGGGCYGSSYNKTNSIVNYYGSFEQGQCDTTMTFDLNGDGRPERVHLLCPHYISVCFRGL